MRKYSKKELKDFVSLGLAKDITYAKRNDLEEVGKLNKIGYSCSTIGITGGLYENNEGDKFVVLGRTANIYL